MIISEKQIITLMLRLQDYITILVTLRDSEPDFLTESGKINLDKSIELINQIYDQQSEELKVIE